MFWGQLALQPKANQLMEKTKIRSGKERSLTIFKKQIEGHWIKQKVKKIQFNVEIKTSKQKDVKNVTESTNYRKRFANTGTRNLIFLSVSELYNTVELVVRPKVTGFKLSKQTPQIERRLTCRGSSATFRNYHNESNRVQPMGNRRNSKIKKIYLFTKIFLSRLGQKLEENKVSPISAKQPS